jgi:hypothetical protein
MKFSAERAARKWPCGRTAAAIVTAGVLLSVGMPSEPATAARQAEPFPWGGVFGANQPRPRKSVRSAPSLTASVPLPRPRPAEAPAVEPEQPVAEKPPLAPDAPADARGDKTAEPAAAPGPPPPTACRLALTEAIAIAPSIPDIHGAGGCGGEDLVTLEAVVLADRRQVALKPPATLRCAMASQIADWVRTDVAPLTAGLGSPISVLDNFDSFECRGRNRVVGAPLSEHGRANALDVRAFKLANGQSISLTDRNVTREVRETVLHSVCARFTTVLGPGSDGYHEDHIHLDLMQRHNNYKICQWYVWDAMPQIAPLLPAERPEEAPPRDIAAKSDTANPDTPSSDVAKPDPAKPMWPSLMRPSPTRPAPTRALPNRQQKNAGEPALLKPLKDAGRLTGSGFRRRPATPSAN